MAESTNEHLLLESVLKESWFTAYWRPAMAWLWFVIILFDFLLAPLVIGYFVGTTVGFAKMVPWSPISLQAGGVIHIMLGAVNGISAYTRTQEKIYGVSNTPVDLDRRLEYIEEKRRKLDEIKRRNKEKEA